MSASIVATFHLIAVISFIVDGMLSPCLTAYQKSSEPTPDL